MSKARGDFRNRPCHFIGIGGIGMSGLAQMLLSKGCRVTGSDLRENEQTRRLSSLGASILIGHSAQNVPGGATVVYSSAVRPDNPELVTARERGLTVVSRGELLAQFFNAKQGIAVSGTHGKTTTTALMTLILDRAGMDPDAIIGGEVESLGGNVRCGGGDIFVAEADESDGSLRHLFPLHSIVTNIEAEHLSYFGHLDAIVDLFRKCLSQTKKGGAVYLNVDNSHLDGIYRDYVGRKVACSIGEKGDIHVRDLAVGSFGSQCTVVYRDRSLGKLELNIPGTHNVANSLGPIALATDLGIDFDTVRRALSTFKGVARRFEVKGEVDGIVVIDDYAHHPTEIVATIESAKSIDGMKRIIGVFQPHRFSRTDRFQHQFAESFDGLDELILTDIYSASEEPIRGISGRTILDRVLEHGGVSVTYVEDYRTVPEHVVGLLQPGDVVLVMGAGTISTVCGPLVELLKSRAARAQ
jgi:UDP-N-acetylmuramate--alanine ligase